MPEKKKAGVAKQFILLCTPFLLYAAAITLISVFVLSSVMSASPVLRLLMSGSGGGNGTVIVDYTVEKIQPEIKEEPVIIIDEEGNEIIETKIYYDKDSFEDIPWGACWGYLTLKYVGADRVPLFNGDTTDMLNKGVCHYFFSMFPGQGSNCVLDYHVNRQKKSGLYNLQDVPLGELIEIETGYGTYVYRITSKDIFEADDLTYIMREGEDILTIYTCYPKQGPYRLKRIAITATLQEDLSDPVWR